MYLHVFIALLFILLTGGFSLECYHCRDEPDVTCNETMRCPYEESRCANLRRVVYMGGVKYETIEEDCVRASECNSWSFTATPVRFEYSVQCCDTDMCNDRPAPDLNSQLNGKKCYSCNLESCSQKVNCMKNENHCFTANDFFPPSSMIMKGCASEFACGLSRHMLPPHANVTCCEGNLCNAVQRISQSFLFLCCSLIFYFLLN
ncbi:phospholipase A2 inhibitor gamma subunit B [Siphateles boraxobius]|uniref:phospholipase A2 inhibitor gamma subunit B n=1 Tax=Siphateles boraxobius TaxID=180520 RepID=UPI004063A8A3